MFKKFANGKFFLISYHQYILFVLGYQDKKLYIDFLIYHLFGSYIEKNNFGRNITFLNYCYYIFDT